MGFSQAKGVTYFYVGVNKETTFILAVYVVDIILSEESDKTC